MHSYLYKFAISSLSAISISLLLLLCIIPALFYGAISPSSIIIIHLIAVLVFLFLLLQRFIKKESFLIKIGIGKPLLALLFIIVLSSFNSIYFFNTQLELHKVITYLIIFIAVATFFQSERRLKFLAYWIIGSAALIAVIGVAKYISIACFDKLWPQAKFATFVSVDSFGAYVTMGLPLAVALLFCNIRIYTKILLGFISFVLIASLLLNCDKGGWLGIMVSTLFLFIFLRYEGLLKRKFWFATLFFILFLWSLEVFIGIRKILEEFIPLFVLNPKDAFDIGYDGTIWNRITIWKSALKAVFEHPFLGVGLGNFKLIYPVFRDETIRLLVRYAHQDFLQFTVETGIFGLISLLWLGFSFFRKMITRVKFQPISFLTGLKVGALSGCFSMIYYSLYYFSFHIPSNVILFIILSGGLTALYFMQDKSKIAYRTNIVRGTYLVSCVIIICYMVYLGRLFSANENYKKGRLAMNRFSFTEAEGYFKKALSYVPHNSEYAARLGELYTHRSRFKIDQDFYKRKSIDLYKRALRFNPYNGNLHIEAGITEARFGRKKEAIKSFRKAVSLDPNNVFYRTVLARHAARWGDFDTAEKEFKKASLIKQKFR